MDLHNGLHLISTERILELHSQALIQCNQEQLAIGDVHRECVEGKIGNAWTAETYVDQPNILSGLCFAGYLLFYLVKGHCFPDGNKRIGWIAAIAVLAELGLTVNATDEEAISLVLDVANDQIKDGNHIVHWLARHLARRLRPEKSVDEKHQSDKDPLERFEDTLRTVLAAPKKLVLKEEAKQRKRRERKRLKKRPG